MNEDASDTLDRMEPELCEARRKYVEQFVRTLRHREQIFIMRRTKQDQVFDALEEDVSMYEQSVSEKVSRMLKS